MTKEKLAKLRAMGLVFDGVYDLIAEKREKINFELKEIKKEVKKTNFVFSPSELGNNDNLKEFFKDQGNILNVFVYPDVENILTMNNWAQSPGAFQVELQKNAKNLIIAVYCPTANALLNEFEKIKKQGFEIGNLVIESHGHSGEGFYIGNYTKKNPSKNFFNINNVENSGLLKKIGSQIKGDIVLTGCQIGTNNKLLVKIANVTQRNIIASEGWVTDWPAMFNDQTTSRVYMKYIVSLLFEHSKKFKDEVIKRAKEKTGYYEWILRMKRFKNDVIEGVLDTFYSTVISPCGTADIIEDIGEIIISGDPYYDPKRPLTKEENLRKNKPPTMRVMFEERVGEWRFASPRKIEGTIVDYYVPKQSGTFYFDKAGNPKFDKSISFYETEWGAAYKTLVENLYSTVITKH